MHQATSSVLRPLGVGWVMWRSPEDLPDELVFHVSYLGGDMPTFQINFSRPAGQVIAQYHEFVRLGREGYRLLHQASHSNAQYVAKALGQMGPFQLIHDGAPEKGIPTVVWTLKEGWTPGSTSMTLRIGCGCVVGRCRLIPSPAISPIMRFNASW